MPLSTSVPLLIAGVMSGTSADGIDVALCSLRPLSDPQWGELLLHHAVPYSPSVRERIHSLRRLGACTLAELAQLTHDLTLEHADAVKQCLEKANKSGSDLHAVADHGQTLFHAPPLTQQVLDPALLAWHIGAPVLSDFRRADLAAGGQGAPLVPYADLRLFASTEKRRALLNLGGIANITALVPGQPPKAFDTGPANCLSDHLCRVADPTGPGHDLGGALARKGNPSEKVVAAFAKSDYFRKPPPKSTDGPEMIEAFRVSGGTLLPFEDALATAAECVARTVADALAAFDIDEVIASGGGLYNLALTSALTRALKDTPLLSTDQLGVPGQAKEAIAFALLAQATLLNRPANLPSCTGATRPVVLGSLTPRP